MTIRINPSILAADFVNLQTELESVSAADYIHVDVMDNHFVPNLTFGQQMVSRLQQISHLPLDLHLMIADVDKWALDFAKYGVFSITFHVEASNDPIELSKKLRALGIRAGLALKPDTSVDWALQHIAEFDQILVMTVEPGFGGQSFMPDVLTKVRALRKEATLLNCDVWIQVDGGIDRNTIESAANAGADTFVSGSAIFKAPDRNLEINQLRELALAASTA